MKTAPATTCRAEIDAANGDSAAKVWAPSDTAGVGAVVERKCQRECRVERMVERGGVPVETRGVGSARLRLYLRDLDLHLDRVGLHPRGRWTVQSSAAVSALGVALLVAGGVTQLASRHSLRKAS